MGKGKYGKGISTCESLNMEKDELKHAIDGEVVDFYDDDNKPVYRKATQEECRKTIIRIYDGLVWSFLRHRAALDAVRELCGSHPECDPDLNAYDANLKWMLKHKYSDYILEPDFRLGKG